MTLYYLFLFYVCGSLSSMYTCTLHICVAHKGQIRPSDPLELELHIYPAMWVLRLEPRSSARTNSLDPWSISPALCSVFPFISQDETQVLVNINSGASQVSRTCLEPQSTWGWDRRFQGETGLKNKIGFLTWLGW